jgi:anti-sigma28 factor (negative regulator of flagellin synthesis)
VNSCWFHENKDKKLFGDQQKMEETRNNKRFFASGQNKSDDGMNSAFSGLERKGGTRRKRTTNLKAKSSEKSPPIRKQKVEEAKRKMLNGEYDTQEVYRKIAEKLIDYFGL